jgi:hypothetical protein
MYDIFHYNRPFDNEGWARTQPVQKYVGRLARLKPEMLSSYIFYHYQLQEETPGQGNKTGIINLHENLMFFYHEEPEIYEDKKYDGKLKTSNSPENWVELMEQHFIFWVDVPENQNVWININHIFSI